MVEQVTVNHLAAGSIPARAAILNLWQILQIDIHKTHWESSTLILSVSTAIFAERLLLTSLLVKKTVVSLMYILSPRQRLEC